MKFQKTTNDELIHILKSKAQTERNLTLEIIELLEELDSRKLHLKMGFGSLIEFCIRELKYSESAAYRRISAMRVVKDVPQAKASLTSGTLNLVTLSQAQTLLNQEKKYNNKSYSKNEKLELITSLENKSKRECEKILIEKSPDLPKPEKVRQITPGQTQVTITLNSELINKLEALKHQYSHINPGATYSELLEIMADKLLKKSTERRNTATPPGGVATRYIPSAVKQEVYLRDKGCCTFKDNKTHQKCSSKHLLQYDHIKPFSYGGKSSVENLRLLCFQHHKLVTESVFARKSSAF